MHFMFEASVVSFPILHIAQMGTIFWITAICRTPYSLPQLACWSATFPGITHASPIMLNRLSHKALATSQRVVNGLLFHYFSCTDSTSLQEQFGIYIGCPWSRFPPRKLSIQRRQSSTKEGNLQQCLTTSKCSSKGKRCFLERWSHYSKSLQKISLFEKESTASDMPLGFIAQWDTTCWKKCSLPNHRLLWGRRHSIESITWDLQ